jgi:hypothetical protein
MYQAAAFVALGVAFIGLTLLMRSPSLAGPSGLGCDEDRDDSDGPPVSGK